MRATITNLNRVRAEISTLQKRTGKFGELPEFVPHEAQREIIDTSKRFNVLCMGRRWGKTTLGRYLLQTPALEGYPVAWFSPVYRNITEIWREFVFYLRPAIYKTNTSERRIELYTGGVIEFWSLDKSPDLVRGRKYARIIVDEAALIRDLKNIWYLILRPLLTDYAGSMYMVSTPRGFNDFYDFYEMGQAEKFPLWQSWRKSSYTNPYLPPEEIDQARAEMPAKAFRQEYLAEFLPTLAGGMFDRDWFPVWESVPRGISFKRRVRAWDLAATTGDNSDFTAGVLLGEVGDNGSPPYVILDVIRGKWSVAERDRVIRDTAERDGSGVEIVIEEEGGSAGKSQTRSLVRLLAGYRITPVRATGDKATRAAPFASQVEAGNVAILRGNWNAEYLNELEGFPDPLALHDDMVDATSYAFNALIEGNRYEPYVSVTIIS